MYAPAIIKRRMNYRCMRKFNDHSFSYDVFTTPFHICNVFEDVDDISWAQQGINWSNRKFDTKNMAIDLS